MHITALTIENLRNLKSVRVAPAPGFNLFYGDNGAGKTTVLEAILMLAKGRSFRSGALASLKGPADRPIRIVAEFVDDEGQAHRAGVERDRTGWRGRIDGEDMRQISDTAAFFPLILMEPTSHELVSGPPDARRRYLDWAVFHVKPSFLSLWRRYGHAIKQRNAALRLGDRRLVESLDPQVIQLGRRLHEDRLAVMERLEPVVLEVLGDLSPRLASLSVNYTPGWQGDDLGAALEQGLARDLDQGLTRQGPHRADLQLRVRNRSVRDRLSRGEQKILAAALLLAQGRLFEREGHVPLVLLDDLASEFDQEHLEQVVRLAREVGTQLFVTGTEPEPYEFLPADRRFLFHVKHGEIQERDAPETTA